MRDVKRKRKGRFSKFMDIVDGLSTILEGIYYLGRGIAWIFKLFFKLFKIFD